MDTFSLFIRGEGNYFLDDVLAFLIESSGSIGYVSETKKTQLHKVDPQHPGADLVKQKDIGPAHWFLPQPDQQGLPGFLVEENLVH